MLSTLRSVTHEMTVPNLFPVNSCLTQKIMYPISVEQLEYDYAGQQSQFISGTKQVL
uniref:Uncharacterized protein n=1 Tax=Arion vulgaris TaxID=1028688 RepID=A0A0B7AYA8_9EUPU